MDKLLLLLLYLGCDYCKFYLYGGKSSALMICDKKKWKFYDGHHFTGVFVGI